MEMLDTLIWCVIVYMAVRLVTNAIMETEAYKESRQELLEHADRMIREVKFEILKEHNTVLAYDKENNDFLGQATSEDAVKALLKERFPKKVFLIDGTNEIVTALPIKEKL